MTTRTLLGGLSALAVLLSPLAVAGTQAPAAPAPGTAAPAAPAAQGKVAQALAAHKAYITEARPSTTARYYAYVCSASWCAPCRQGMPILAHLYKEMKASGVLELIFVGYDGTAVEANVFLSRHGAEFPATMRDDCEGLPGYQRQHGIPIALIVDAEGNKVLTDHASVLQRWKQIISNYEEKNGLPPSFAAPAADK